MKVNRKSDEYLNTFKPLEVVVNGRIEEAIGKFRSLVTKERIMSDLKEHASYEKPSEKKRRKMRESRQRQYKANLQKNQQQYQVDEFDNLP